MLVPCRGPACRSSRPEKERPMATVSVRYFVRDIDAAIDFYCQLLDFHVAMHPNASFAMLSRGDLRLVLSVPGGGPGGGQAMPDGRLPEPGGWNRFQLEVADLAATVETLRARGSALPQRHRRRRRRQPDRGRRPLRQPDRDRPADDPRGEAGAGRNRIAGGLSAVALRVARRACTRLDLELLGQRPGLGAALSPTRAPCPARRALPAAPRCDP